MDKMVELKNVSKSYRQKGKIIQALQDINLSVQPQEFVTIVGPSGSGKTTLLLTIGGMLRPTSGSVYIKGTNIYEISNRDRVRFRAENIGFVFQMFHLVTYLSLLDNALLPWVTGIRHRDRNEVLELLERFGLGDRIHHKPGEVSTGERQRAAIVRAILNKPKLLLADEPTGNLDVDNSREIMNYLRNFREAGGTVIVVSHESLAKEYADRTLTIRNGRLED